jgi:polysaccharide pyruvyl transferase WcaK-like protein
MKYPADRDTIFDILRECRGKSGITIADKALDPLELISMLAGCQFAITTRYHGVILAGLAGTPVISLSYHPKVLEAMKMLNLEDFAIDIALLSHEIVLDKVGYLVSHLEEASSRMLAKVDAQRKDAREMFVKLYKKWPAAA